MRPIVKSVVKGAGAMLIVSIGIGAWALYPKLSSMKSEYVTAQVIRDLDAYVVAHPGKWPQSWKDLGDGSDHSQFTRVRFDLSTEQILRQPQLIHEAVTPVSGKYYTYPHAGAQLEQVLERLKRGALP